MKQELMKKITPILEGCVDEVLKSFGDIDKIRKNLIYNERFYQDLNEDKKKELAEIKKQKEDGRLILDQKITEHEEAKSELQLKTKAYEDLKTGISRRDVEIADDLAKAKIELARSRDAEAQADQLKQEAQKIKADYERKLGSLKMDFEKTDQRVKDIDHREKKVSAREREYYKQKTKLDQDQQDINDKELRIQLERKEINRLVKRYNLEHSLKEA